MASFAEIGADGKVLQVVEVTDDNVPDEAAGIAFLDGGSWKQVDATQFGIGDSFVDGKFIFNRPATVFRNIPMEVTPDIEQTDIPTYVEIF